MNQTASGTSRSGLTYVRLGVGDPAPWFVSPSPSNPNYNISSAAGRYVVLCFLGSVNDARGRAAFDAALARRDLFDDMHASFFAITSSPADAAIGNILPGYRPIHDFDLAVARSYGVAPIDGADNRMERLQRRWLVLDPTLRVINVTPFAKDGSDGDSVMAFLEGLPPPSRFAGIELQAPVLYLPNVFEPELCRTLIDYYETHGGEESGFMREVDGKTVLMTDPAHKRRRDCQIDDDSLRIALQKRIVKRIVPEISKVHQFQATRMERYIVGCYTAEDGGHFRAHRDNTTRGTAHRRFAVSINLNSEFEGGELSFPEYGPRGYKPPPGGAVVFSCSLLHAASRVTAGRRYAFLPFLYDDAAAVVRESNNAYLDQGIGAYKVE